jgi:hypothetical protein
MKVKKVYLLLAVPVFVVTGVYIYFFTGPYRFVEFPLEEGSLRHLRSGVGSGASWLASPSETAFEYRYWWPGPESERPNRSKIDITTSYRSTDEAIVTIIDNDTRERRDSIPRICIRLTLRRQSGVWIPVREQDAWQFRGRFGWTTQPTP